MTTANIKLASRSINDMDIVAKQIKEIAQASGIECRGPIPLPTKRLTQPVRRTPCGDGSHTYEHWQMRISKRMLVIVNVSEQAFRQIMRIAVPDSIQIKINLLEN